MSFCVRASQNSAKQPDTRACLSALVYSCSGRLAISCSGDCVPRFSKRLPRVPAIFCPPAAPAPEFALAGNASRAVRLGLSCPWLSPRGLLAQWLAHRAAHRGVAGSVPARCSFFFFSRFQKSCHARRRSSRAVRLRKVFPPVFVCASCGLAAGKYFLIFLLSFGSVPAT